MSLPLFVFGTLRHPPLLEALVGDASRLSITPSHLPGYAVMAMRDDPFPALVKDPSSSAEGLLVEGLGAPEREILDFYESAFQYRLEHVQTEEGQSAVAYFPPDKPLDLNGFWSLEDWAADWGAICTAGAREVALLFGTMPAEEVGALLPMIWARAASDLRAQQSKNGTDAFNGEVEVIGQSREYTGFLALDTYRLRHSRFAGGMTKPLDRAVLLSPDAATVLPYDPLRDCVLLIEQMRMGPLARGDTQLWQLEPIAGRVDPGETPMRAARREAVQEAGLTLDALYPVAEAYASPGTSSEFFYVFVGVAELPPETEGTGGSAEENEDIRSRVIPFDALMALCDGLMAANTPLVMSAYWLARHRQRLRKIADESKA